MFSSLANTTSVLTAFAVVVVTSGDATANTQRRTHVVKRGQTLSKIARVYGCKIRELRRANRKAFKREFIRPGQRLAIPRDCDRDPAPVASRSEAAAHVPALEYKVRRGDNLGKIARRFDVSIRHIRSRNRIRKYLRAGQILRIIPGSGGKGRAVPGQSIGWAHGGHLANAMQLPESRFYFRRRPHFAYGANHTIAHVRRMVRHVRRKFRRLHKLAIGDISRKTGGHLTTHKSHQTGRDIDIGYYFKKKPDQYPESFASANERNMHLPANWAMLRYLVSTARSPGGVELIFINTSVQKILYDWAKKRGVSRRTLDAMFQYPRGGGIIRHAEGHDNHMHVRFKCPPRDKACK